MAIKIITGYTGERHITAKDDSQVHRAIWGGEDTAYILPFGSRLSASMPSINEFQINDGWIIVQGRYAVNARETISVDVCQTGKKRVDLIIARYTIDTSSLIENIELLVLKGTEVDAVNTPAAPACASGDIDDGATQVDVPLYRIDLSGGTVTFTKIISEIDASIFDVVIDPSVISLYEALGAEI